MAYEIGVGYLSIVPSLKGFSSELEKQLMGPMKKASDQSGSDSGGSFLGSFKGKLFAGIAGIAVAAGAAFVDSYTEALDVRKMQAKAQAALGLTDAQATNLGKTAGNLYAKGYGESISELTDSVASVQSAFQNLHLPDSQLEELTGKAISFSQAFDTDVSSAVQNVNTLIGSGLVKNADEAFDLLTRSSQKVPAALRGDIADASDEYSQFFRTLGFSGPQAFDALVKGADKGTFGIDKTGDAIKEFTIRSTDMSKSSVDAFSTIGLDAQTMSDKILSGGDAAHEAFTQIVDGVTNIQDPTVRANTAIALFGTQMEDMNVADVPQFLQGLKGMSGGMDDASGAADKMDQAMGSTTSGVELFWRGLKANLVDFITEKVLPAVTAFTQWLGDELQPVVQFVGAWIQESLVPAIQDLTVWMGEHLGPVVEKAGAFFRDNLIPFIQQAVVWFNENLLPVVQRVGEFIGSTFENIATVVGGIIDFLSGVFTGDWSKAWEGIKEIFSGIWAQIQNIVSTAWDVVTGIGSKILDWLSGLPGWAWERISAFAGQLVQWGTQFLQWLWDGIQAKAVEVWNWFTSLPGSIWDRVAAFASQLWTWGTQFLQWIWDGIQNKALEVWGWFTALPGTIWGIISGFSSDIWGWGSSLIGWVKDGIVAGAVDIWNFILAIPDKFVELLGQIGQKLWDFGKSVVNWVVDGIKSKISAVADAITSLFQDLTFNADGTISTPQGYVTANPFAGSTARGGVIPGVDPGRRDNVLGRLPNGVGWGLRSEESVFVPEFTRAIGGAPTVNAWNRAAERGTLGDYLPGFARGGVVGYGELASQKIADRVRDDDDSWVHGLFDGATNMWKQVWGSLVRAGSALITNFIGAIGGNLNYSPGAGVEQWRGTVLQALALTGQSPALANTVLYQMQTESGGNPNAINNYDSNAMRGDPSRGLMQTIMSTFQAYRLPGLSDNIYDPLSNIVAAIRYTISRYGSVSAGMQGRPYDVGGWLMPGMTGINQLNRPEAVLTPAQSDAYIAHAKAVEDGYSGRPPAYTFTGDIHVQSPEEFFREAAWQARSA